jgi:hypothetical protein
VAETARDRRREDLIFYAIGLTLVRQRTYRATIQGKNCIAEIGIALTKIQAVMRSSAANNNEARADARASFHS